VATRCWKAETSGTGFCPHGCWISPRHLETPPAFLAFTGNGFVPHAFWSGAPSLEMALLFIGREDVGKAGGLVAGQST